MLTALIPPALALVIAVPLSYSAAQASRIAEEAVQRSIRVRETVEQMRAAMFEAASRLRGYVLTDHDGFRSDHLAARAQIGATVEQLEALVANDQAQSLRLARLRPVLESLVRSMDDTLAEYEAGHLTRSGTARLSIETKTATDEADSILNEMKRAEAITLSSERTSAADDSRRLELVIELAIPLALVLSLAIFTVVSTRATRRLRSLEDNAHRLAVGQPLARMDVSLDEIGGLARSLEAASQVLAEKRAVESEHTRALTDLYENAPCGYHSLDADGRFLRINETELKWLGYGRDEILGVKTIYDVVTPASADTVRRSFPVFKQTGSVENLELDMVRKDGTIFPALLSASAIRDERGNYLMSRSTLIDISERRRAEDAAMRQASLLDRVADAVISVDNGFRITGWNRGAEKVYGWRAQEVMGRAISDVVPSDLSEEEGREILTRLTDEGLWIGETTQYRRDGTPVAIEASVMADKDADGNIVGFATVNRDVTARRLAEDLRREAEEQIRAANTAKTEFLSRMSHELRTPLNAILGFGQLLEMEDLPPDQEESVRRILSAGHHLLDLINEVLDISRIETGTLTLSLEPVRVAEALAEVVDLMTPLANVKGISMEVLRPSLEELHVRADRQRLKQVIINLVSNAVKYGRPNGHIRVRTTLIEGTCRIDVADDGPGIAPSDVERIFLPFERIPGTDASVEGTGLGLALSRNLVEAMGGTLTVTSEPGAGSTFHVDLPVTEGQAVAGPAAQAASSRQAQDGSPALLYIEDNPSNLRLVQRILERRPGVSLLSAMQGSIGLELAREHRPDLILLDLHLPDMDGREVLRELRTDPRTSRISVLVITADATTTSRHRLLESGAAGFLTKPFDVAEFLAAVDSALEQRNDD